MQELTPTPPAKRPYARRMAGASVEDRFWARVEKTDSCWLWTASCNNGYGILGVGKRYIYTHRFSYELHKGPIPDGLVIDHICRQRTCVNPDHLRAVTVRVNATENSSSVPALNMAKTHCHAGHPFDRDNTVARAGGSRACRECKRVWNKERAVLKAEALKLLPEIICAAQNVLDAVQPSNADPVVKALADVVCRARALVRDGQIERDIVSGRFSGADC